MQRLTIQDLQNGPKNKPYQTGVLKIKILKVGHTAEFTDVTGKPCPILNFSVGDNGGAMLASCMNEKINNTIKEGKSLQIRNFYVAKNKVSLNNSSKVMACPEINVPEDVLSLGTTLITPPSPSKSLKDAMEMKPKDLVTVQGQIIRDEAVRHVQVKSKETPIRTISLEENGCTMEVTLWRDLVNERLNVGNYIELSHCVISEWQQNIVLNTTRNTEIKNVTPRDITLQGVVEGVHYIQEDETMELCISDGNILKDIIVPMGILKSAIIGHFNIQDDIAATEFENTLIANMPFNVNAIMNNSLVREISVL